MHPRTQGLTSRAADEIRASIPAPPQVPRVTHGFHVSQPRSHRRAGPLSSSWAAHAVKVPTRTLTPQQEQPQHVHGTSGPSTLNVGPACTVQHAAHDPTAGHRPSIASSPLLLELLPDWQAYWHHALLASEESISHATQALVTLERICGSQVQQSVGPGPQQLHSAQPQLSTSIHAVAPSCTAWADVAARLAAVERCLVQGAASSSVAAAPGVLSVEQLCLCADSLCTIMLAAWRQEQQHLQLQQQQHLAEAQEQQDSGQLRLPQGLSPAAAAAAQAECARLARTACDGLAQALWAAVPGCLQAGAPGSALLLTLSARLALLPGKPTNPQQLHSLWEAVECQLVQPAAVENGRRQPAHPSRRAVSSRAAGQAGSQQPKAQLSATQLQQLACSIAILGSAPDALQQYVITAWQRQVADAMHGVASTAGGEFGSTHTATQQHHATFAPTLHSTSHSGPVIPDVHSLVVMLSALALGCSIVPPRDWLRGWAQAVAAGLPAADAPAVVQLLQLLAALPRSTISQLEHEPSFWAAVWEACPGRLFKTHHIATRLKAAASSQQQSRDAGELAGAHPCTSASLDAAAVPQHSSCLTADGPADLQHFVPSSSHSAALVMAALRAAAKLRKHGVAPPDTWILSAIQHQLRYVQQVSQGSQQPDLAQPQHPASLSKDQGSQREVPADRGQDTTEVDPATILVRVLQAVHHTAVVLPAADAHLLVGLLEIWLPQLPRVQLSKSLPMLPQLASQLARRSADRLYRVMLRSMAAALLQLREGNQAAPHPQAARQVGPKQDQPHQHPPGDSSAQPHLSHEVPSSRSPRCQAAAADLDQVETLSVQTAGSPAIATTPGSFKSASAQPCDGPADAIEAISTAHDNRLDGQQTSGPSPLEAWELSNWLHALSSREHAARAAGGGSAAVQAAGQRLLQPLLEAAGPGALRNVTNGDLVSIVSGLAHMQARLDEEWLVAILSSACARRWSALATHQLVTMSWACARLGVGRLAPPAWIARLQTITHGCMETLPPHSLAQMAWSMATMQRQARDGSGQPLGAHGMRVVPWDARATWLAQLMHATATASREANARTLSSMICSVAMLMQDLRPTASQPHSVHHGYDIKLEQLGTWAEHMLQAFSRRLHTADGHSMSCMLSSIAVLSELLGSTRLPPSMGSCVSDSIQRLHSLAVRRVASSQAPNAAARVAGGGLQCSIEDLAVSAAAMATMASLVPVPQSIVYEHLALAVGLTASVPPSGDAARGLSTVLLAFARLLQPHAAAHSLQLDGAVPSLGSLPAPASYATNTSPSQPAPPLALSPQQAMPLASSTAAVALHSQPTGLPLLSIQRPFFVASSQAEQQTEPSGASHSSLGSAMAERSQGPAGQPYQQQQQHSQLPAGRPVALLLQQLAQHLPVADAGCLAAVWLALGRLRYCPDRETLGVLLLSCHRRMHEMTGAQLSHMVWAMCRLGLQPDARWLDRMQLVVYKAVRRGDMQWRGRATVAWAAGRCGWPLHREFAIALMPDEQALPELGLLDLSMVTWACGRLGLRPDQAWVRMLLMASARLIAQLCTTLPMPSQDSQHGEQGGSGTDRAGLAVNTSGAQGGSSLRSAANQGAPSHASNAERDVGATRAHSSWPAGQELMTAKLGAAQAGQLLMLAKGLSAWLTRAPHWWWSPWAAAMHAAVPTLSLASCSATLRELARCQSSLLRLSPNHHELTLAIRRLVDALIQRMVHVLRAGEIHPSDTAACAVALWAAADISTLDLKAARQAAAAKAAVTAVTTSSSGLRQQLDAGSSVSALAGRAQSPHDETGSAADAQQGHGVGSDTGEVQEALGGSMPLPPVLLISPLQHRHAEELVSLVLRRTQPHLATCKPGYLVLLAAAVTLVQSYDRAVGSDFSSSAWHGAVGDTRRGAPAVESVGEAVGTAAGRLAWVEELALVLEVRSAEISTVQHHGAQAALAALLGQTRSDSSPAGSGA